MKLIAQLRARFGAEYGATAIEYALMVSLIAMAIIVAVTFLGGSTNTLFQDVGSAVSST